MAQQTLAVDLQDAAQEVFEAVRIERLVAAINERLDLVVVMRVMVMMMLMVVAMIVTASGVIVVVAVIVRVVMAVIVVVVVVVFREEIRVDLELRIQIEAAQVEDFLDVRIAEIDDANGRARVHVQQAMLERFERGGIDEIGLGDEQAVRETDLPLHHFVLVELRVRVFCIDEGDDRVEQEFVGDRVVHEKRLRHGARIRETRRFDHHAVEIERPRLLAVSEVFQRARQIAANRAADAAVAHLDDLLVRFLHEDFVVDVLFAELVLDHGDLHAVLLVQNALEQRGFAATQKAGQDGYGNHGVACVLVCVRGLRGPRQAQ